jgi:hypothetical protein
MAAKDEQEDCVSNDCKTDRYERQLEEGREAVKESVSALEYARRKLDKAMQSLSVHGDAPFEDLERN